MNDCIFCKIINKELGSKVVYEDDKVMAFYDIHPAAKVHVLVIPKKHITSLLDLSEEDKELIGHLYLCINKVTNILGIDEKGFRVIVNCGENGGQEVGHLHFHILGGERLGAKIR